MFHCFVLNKRNKQNKQQKQKDLIRVAWESKGEDDFFIFACRFGYVRISYARSIIRGCFGNHVVIKCTINKK